MSTYQIPQSFAITSILRSTVNIIENHSKQGDSQIRIDLSLMYLVEEAWLTFLVGIQCCWSMHALQGGR